MKTNFAMQRYIRWISKELMGAGISQEDTLAVVTELNDKLQREITDEIIDSLEPEERDELDAAGDEVSDEAFLDIVGYTQKDVEARYLQKLESYMAELPEHIASIKAHLVLQRGPSEA